MRAYEQLLVSFGPAVVRQIILEARGGGMCPHCDGSGKCDCRGCCRGADGENQPGFCTLCLGSGTIAAEVRLESSGY